MQKNINLLPSDYLLKSPLAKKVQIIKKLNFAMVSVVLLISFTSLIGYLFFSIQITETKKKQDILTSQIASLEKSEQQLFLIKDRLSKINSSIMEQVTLGNLSSIDLPLFDTRVGAEIEEVNVTPDVTDISLTAKNSNELNQAVDYVISKHDFQLIKLLSLSFNPSYGYTMSLKLSK